jgi:chromosome partitioning protein
MMGIKELLSEVEEIKKGTNPNLRILGYLLTQVDQTKIAFQAWDGLVDGFGDQVFESKIRKNVKLREAPVFGKTIFHHAPKSTGAEDYLSLADEVIGRLAILPTNSKSLPLAAMGGAR